MCFCLVQTDTHTWLFKTKTKTTRHLAFSSVHNLMMCCTVWRSCVLLQEAFSSWLSKTGVRFPVTEASFWIWSFILFSNYPMQLLGGCVLLWGSLRVKLIQHLGCLWTLFMMHWGGVFLSGVCGVSGEDSVSVDKKWEFELVWLMMISLTLSYMFKVDLTTLVTRKMCYIATCTTISCSWSHCLWLFIFIGSGRNNSVVSVSSWSCGS